MRVKTLNVYLPEGLDISDELTFADGIKNFVSTIYWKQLEGRLPWDHGVCLKYDYLRSNIPEWKKVWRWCSKNQVVERVGGYTVGEHSYGYRLSETYRGKTHRLSTIDSPVIARRLRKASIRFQKRSVMIKLYDCLQRVSVDLERFESLYGDHPEREYYRAHLNTMVWGDWRFTEDNFSKRIHSNITNLYKPLRSFLRVDGGDETLSEIDIRNSQPLFLGMEAQRSRVEDEPFLRLCSEGLIYEELGRDIGLDRNQSKEEFMKFLFAKNGFRSRAKSVFGSRFPQISQYVNDLKERDHRRIARCLQKAERKFVIDVVCDRLFQEVPEIFLTTIHDSILCKREHGELVRDVMLDEFEQRGVSPNLTVVML
jgi:hypothetical protein